MEEAAINMPINMRNKTCALVGRAPARTIAGIIAGLLVSLSVALSFVGVVGIFGHLVSAPVSAQESRSAENDAAGVSEEAKRQFVAALRAYKERRIDDAVEILQRLHKQYPYNVAVLNNLAVVAFDKGDTDKAIALLRRALSTDRDIMATYNNLTAVYEIKAAMAYRNALNIPNNVEPPPLNMIGDFSRMPKRVNGKLAGAKSTERGRAIAREILNEQGIDRPFVDDPVQNNGQERKPPKKVTKQPAQAAPAEGEELAAMSQAREDELVETVTRWANAWSNRDLPTYYDSYIKNHSTKRMSHDEWKAARAQRLQAPRTIEITLVDFEVTQATQAAAQVEFVQQYRSNTLSSDALKRLYLVREDDKWKIRREIVLRRLK